MKIGLLGVLLTAVVTGILVTGLGRGALLASLVMGGAATLLQVAAIRALGQGYRGNTAAFFKAFRTGLALRMLGVLLVLLLVLVDRERFPPLPTAFGYLGVVIPLLFLEARFVR